ncbi:hypothetical protein Srufu_038320 [Streptomyces libani subsp. rufus]|nr:hypothetical protein Srufu_038320 [Streptomyces libani subsp. rufus]
MHGVEAQTAGVSDIGRVAVVDGGHVEDEGHPGLQLTVGGEELERHPEVDERGAVAEPGEGQMEPVPDAALAQPLALHPCRRALGHSGLELGGHGFRTGIGESLDLSEPP